MERENRILSNNESRCEVYRENNDIISRDASEKAYFLNIDDWPTLVQNTMRNDLSLFKDNDVANSEPENPELNVTDTKIKRNKRGDKRKKDKIIAKFLMRITVTRKEKEVNKSGLHMEEYK